MSQRGASITFALFLFLMCAMVSAVAIVAATAAGGRLSEIAETDQRYYAVNSAANLLKKELDGQVVEFVETRTETITTKYDAAGNQIGDPVPTGGDEVVEAKKAVETQYSYGDKDAAALTPQADTTPHWQGKLTDGPFFYISSPLETPLVGASCYIAGFKTSNIGTTTAINNDTDYVRRLEIAVSGLEDSENTLLTVNAKEEADKANNTFNIYVWKNYNDKDGNTKSDLGYAVKLTFVADKQSVTDVHTDDKSVTADSGSGYIKKSVRTTTKRTRLVWELVSINKASVPT